MSMFNKVTKTFQWGKHTVTMETVSHRTPARIGQRSTTTRQSFTDRYVQIMDTQ